MNSLNVVMLMEQVARRSPDRVFLYLGDQTWTYGQVDSLARRFAGALKALGISAGDRMALILPNIPDFVVCYYGILKLGATPVPLHVTTPGPELAYFLNDTGAVGLVAHPAAAQAAGEGRAEAGACRHLILTGPPTDGPAPEGALDFASLLAGAPDDFGSVVRHADDEAVILYTAGTTGRPRGVILSHANMFFSAQFVGRDFWRLGESDVVLMVAPAAHIFGQTLLNAACATRAGLSLLPRFDPPAFFRTLQDHRVTFFAGVPTLLHLMLQSPAAAQFDLSSLRSAMIGGAPLLPDVARRFRSRFPVALTTGYGMTEGVPFTYLTAEEFETAPAGSVGRPALGLSLRIVDPEERDVPVRGLGEIVVRGPQVFLGYVNQTEATRQAMRADWFHTGDVGWQDEHGHVFLVDRLKDMIKRSGYSVAPAEVERVLMSHPAVAEVAVVGVPDPTRGEEIKAFVVLKEGTTASEEELIAHSREQLAAYKYPRLVEFRDSLPKSPAGKILRRVLKDSA